MSKIEAKLVVKRYYKYIKLGTPFISSSPEELVWSAILSSSIFSKWNAKHLDNFLIWTPNMNKKNEILKYKNKVFFYQRKSRKSRNKILSEDLSKY